MSLHDKNIYHQESYKYVHILFMYIYIYLFIYIYSNTQIYQISCKYSRFFRPLADFLNMPGASMDLLAQYSDSDGEVSAPEIR